jgi:hypothetical protein
MTIDQLHRPSPFHRRARGTNGNNTSFPNET